MQLRSWMGGLLLWRAQLRRRRREEAAGLVVQAVVGTDMGAHGVVLVEVGGNGRRCRRLLQWEEMC